MDFLLNQLSEYKLDFQNLFGAVSPVSSFVRPVSSFVKTEITCRIWSTLTLRVLGEDGMEPSRCFSGRYGETNKRVCRYTDFGIWVSIIWPFCPLGTPKYQESLPMGYFLWKCKYAHLFLCFVFGSVFILFFEVLFSFFCPFFLIQNILTSCFLFNFFKLNNRYISRNWYYFLHKS